MNFENKDMYNKKILTISICAFALTSIIFFGVAKYNQNQENDSLEKVEQKNYKVIKSLFSSDSAKENLTAFNKEMDSFNTKENLCENVKDNLKKQECFNKEGLMKEFISSKNFVKKFLSEELQNENYYYVTSETFEFKEKSDISKFLNEDDSKTLINKYFENRKSIGEKMSFTREFNKAETSKWFMPNYSKTLNFNYTNISNTLELLKKAVAKDCAGFFETEKCNLTNEEVDKLKLPEDKFGLYSGQLNDPFIKQFEDTINNGFQRKIIKIEE